MGIFTVSESTIYGGKKLFPQAKEVRILFVFFKT